VTEDGVTESPAPPPADLAHAPQREVFISYSRADLEFVQRLDEALRAAGRSTWIDRRGIEPTEEWLAAIHTGIDRSTNFLLIVTPRSTASPWVGREVDYAAARNKRLIPILAAATDPDSLPPQIGARQWIDFTPGFAAGLALLLAALDRDLEYVHEHTRLLGRAIDWSSKRGGLLTRTELEAAEQWLAGAHREPLPTELQTGLILASRRAATRTQRQILAAVTAAAILSLALATIAFLQRNEARRQTRIATENLANTMAARALSDTKPRNGLRHAVAALDTAVTPATRGALLSLLQRTDSLRFILDPSGGAVHLQGLALDATGTVLAVVPYQGNVQLWDLRTGTARTSGAVPVAGFRPPAAVSGDLVVLGDQGLRIWRGTEEQPFFSTPDSPEAGIQAVAITGKDRVAAAQDSSIQLCDLATSACIAAAESGVRHLAFAGVGGRWLIAAAENRLILLDGRTLRLLGRMSTEAPVLALAGSAVSPSVSLILTDQRVCSLAADKITTDCSAAGDEADATTVSQAFGPVAVSGTLLALSGDGRLLAVTDYEEGVGFLDVDRSVAVWGPTRERAALASLRTAVAGHIAAVSQDGLRAALQDPAGNVTLTDSATGAAAGKPFKPLGGIATCGRSLVASIGQRLVLYDGATGLVTGQAALPPGDEAASVTISPDERLLAVRRGSRVRFYTPPGAAQSGRELSIGQRSFRFIPGRRAILTFDRTTVDERDIDSGAVTQRPLVPGNQPDWDDDDGDIDVLAISPDGRRIITCGGGLGEGMRPRVVLWDLAHGAVIASQPATGSITMLAFGTGLIAGSDSGRLRLYDAATLQPIGKPIDIGLPTNIAHEDTCSAHIPADSKQVGVFCEEGGALFTAGEKDWRQLALSRAGPLLATGPP
jgi:WD40 repeat protein